MSWQGPQAGFTLLEMMLSVTVIGLLVGLGAPLYATFQQRNDLDLTTQSVASLYRRAATYARANKGDSTWGVSLQSGAMVLYKGATYAGRDTTADETVSLPGSITASGLSDVNYAKLSAVPGGSGTLTLTSSASNDSRAISVNSKGMVAY